MKSHVTFVILLLTVLSALPRLQAQTSLELYLPVSTASAPAKAAYVEALEASEDADIPTFYAKMQSAVKSDPDFFMGYAYLAVGHTFFKQYEEAATFIEPALAIEAGSLNPAEQILREALVALDQDPKADLTSFMTALTEAYPQTAQAHELAATSVYWIGQDYQAAAQHLVHVLELRPAYGGGYNMLGYNYMALGKMDQAKAAFERYLALAPDEANAYDSMGEYYMVNKDYVKSAEYYDRAAAMGMELAKERAEKARAALEAAGK